LPVEILSTLTGWERAAGDRPAAGPGTRDTRETAMADHLDVPLEDATLMEEVELISTLMIAASEAEEPLEQAQIDRLLGVPDEDPDAASGSRLPRQPRGGSVH
jgi:hypothetical protein